MRVCHGNRRIDPGSWRLPILVKTEMPEDILPVTPDVSSDSKAGELRQRLFRATGATDSMAAFQALAELDPASALEWYRDAVRHGQSPEEELRRMAVALSEAARADAEILQGLFRVLRGRPELLESTIVTRVAEGVPGDAWSDEEGRALDSLEDRFRDNRALIRLLAEFAIAQREFADAHRLLTRLGRLDPALPTLQYIKRARQRVPRPEGTEARVGILSSYTQDQLLPFLDLELRDLGLVPDLYLAPFNSWGQEVFGEASGLRRFDPEIVFLSVAIDDLVPGLAGAPSTDALNEAGEEALEAVWNVARRFREWSSAPLVIHGFHSAFPDPMGISTGVGESRTHWLRRLNLELEERCAQQARTHFLDMQDVLIRRSGGAFDDPKLRHMARIRLPEPVLRRVAETYASYVAAEKGLTRKCVVVDLDNTMWGGIVGEDGVEGIRLGNTAPGSEFVEFQEYLAALTERGILLAVASKNNESDALEAIRSHPDMVLREDDFSALAINWSPKPDNLRGIAEQLNIGLDSLVFLDDNPKEREAMRQLLPQVLTPELPPDPARYREVVESLPQLQTLVVTAEDRKRARLYRDQRKRTQIRETAGSL